MIADMPNEGFALGFSTVTKEVCLDGKDGYPTVGTSRMWGKSDAPKSKEDMRGVAIPK
jgi:hypothetical protein